MTILPKQLLDDKFWFVKLHPKTKKPIETKWQKKKYSFKDIPKLKEQGFNCGIQGGHADLLIVDIDSPLIDLSLLPETFTVESQSLGKEGNFKSKHYYYFCPDFKGGRHIKHPEDIKKNIADLIWSGMQACTPGSIHPKSGKPSVVYNDVPIRKVAETEILAVFEKFMVVTDRCEQFFTGNKVTNKFDINISDIINEYKIKLTYNNGRAYGEHPVHGSSTGKNFHVDLNKGVWYCHRCGRGGDAITLGAVMEGFIDCSQAGKRALTGKLFIEVMKALEKRLGKSFLDLNPLLEKKETRNIDWQLTTKGEIVNNISNLDKIVSLSKDFRYNEFNKKIEIVKDDKPRLLEEPDIHTVRKSICDKYQLDARKNDVYDCIIHNARKNPYNPVLNYLKSAQWDNEKRIDTWMIDYLNVEDNAYTRFVSKLFFTSACARVAEPGCKYDHVISFEGEQGIGKGLVLSTLIPNPDWFLEDYSLVNLGNKDKKQQLSGKWIIELCEMKPRWNQDVDEVKSFITCRSDNYRAPYGRIAEDHKRMSVFVGTYNAGATPPFKDETGNRRFFPIEVHFDAQTAVKQLSAIRDRLWAEAWHCYTTGDYILYPEDPEVKRISLSVQADKQQESPYKEIIYKWWKDLESSEKTKFLSLDKTYYEITGYEIYSNCLKYIKNGDFTEEIIDKTGWGKPIQTSIGFARTQLGWGRRKSSKDHNIWCFVFSETADLRWGNQVVPRYNIGSTEKNDKENKNSDFNDLKIEGFGNPFLSV